MPPATRKPAVQMTVSQWAVWAAKRDRDADSRMKAMKVQSRKAKELATNMSCGHCDPMVMLRGTMEDPVFEKPGVTHELGCPSQ